MLSPYKKHKVLYSAVLLGKQVLFAVGEATVRWEAWTGWAQRTQRSVPIILCVVTKNHAVHVILILAFFALPDFVLYQIFLVCRLFDSLWCKSICSVLL
jgi:hypothetical protein